jgi:hypothetical protein
LEEGQTKYVDGASVGSGREAPAGGEQLQFDLASVYVISEG